MLTGDDSRTRRLPHREKVALSAGYQQSKLGPDPLSANTTKRNVLSSLATATRFEEDFYAANVGRGTRISNSRRRVDQGGFREGVWSEEEIGVWKSEESGWSNHPGEKNLP